MPERIVKNYWHLYETKFMHKTLEEFPPEVTIEAFNGGAGQEFPNHYISVALQQHKLEYFAVTYIAKNGEVHARVSLSKGHMANLVDKRPRRKIHLAYEWIHVILAFRERKYNDLPRYTLMNEVQILFGLLAEHTNHCKDKLSDFDLKTHKALRNLLVSTMALEEMLRTISADVQTLVQLRQFTEKEPDAAHKTITWPLIQKFADEWSVEKDIVISRLQEELGLCA
jgi:hypothetical protein